MSAQSMVFGPDQDGESVVIYVEDGSVQDVVLQDAEEQQIPYEDLTKAHWTKMSEAEDRAIEQLRGESRLDGLEGLDDVEERAETEETAEAEETAETDETAARAAVGAVEPI